MQFEEAGYRVITAASMYAWGLRHNFGIRDDGFRDFGRPPRPCGDPQRNPVSKVMTEAHMGCPGRMQREGARPSSRRSICVLIMGVTITPPTESLVMQTWEYLEVRITYRHWSYMFTVQRAVGSDSAGGLDGRGILGA